MRIGTSLGTSLVTAVVGLALTAPTAAAGTHASASPRSALTPSAEGTRAPQSGPTASPSRAKTGKLHLRASRTRVNAGARVGLRVINKSKARRTIVIQRWDPKKRTWRKVAKRSITKTRSVAATVPSGRWRYRAVAPRTKTGRGASARVLPTARSKVVILTAKPRPVTENTARRTVTAGSVPIGSAAYPVPGDAVFVAPTGSDTASGSISAPFRTVGHAINKAKNGGTIVLREGTYHESLLIPRGRRLTLQNHPRERVHLDGSSVVSGFAPAGSAWVKTDWKTSFDRSPTYGRGAPDGTESGWRWINPAHPYAAWPDQVWIDGRAQRQVGSVGELTAGTFYVDYDTDRLYVGSDPTGKEVRASDLELGLTMVGAGSTVRGIGIRRFAPSVPDMGTLRVFGADQTVENVEVVDNATSGVTVYAKGARLRRVTSSRNGLIGFHGHQSNDYSAVGLLAEDNNRERFNTSPAAGAFKLTQSRKVAITDSVFRNNHGTGIWLDVSDYDITVARNVVTGNARHGIVVELSAVARIVNNVVTNNANTGLMILDSSSVQAWNNRITDSQLPIRVADGARVSTADPTITWVTRDVTVKNNVIGRIAAGDNWCGVMCMLDDRKISTAAQMKVSFDGNVYLRSSSAAPKSLIRWAGGSRGAIDYATLADFRRATGLEKSGQEITGSSASMRAGVPLPASIASHMDVPAGRTAVGPDIR